MKHLRFTGLLLMLACSQDLSKMKENSNTSPGPAATTAGSQTVILNKTTTTIAFGSTDQLIATVLPTAQTVTWMSVDTSVATISATGLVTPSGSGTTQVIAQVQGGGAYAVCAITVPIGFTANPAEGSTIETLNTLEITYSTEMNAQALISTNYTISGAGKGTVSTNPLAISKSGNTYTLSFSGVPGNGSLAMTLSTANIKTNIGTSFSQSIINFATHGWFSFIGGTSTDGMYEIKQTHDGGYIAVGYVSAGFASLGGQPPLNVFTAGQEILVVKLTTTGMVQWYTFLGAANNQVAYSIQETSDGGYAIAGTTAADIPFLSGLTPLNAYSSSFDMFFAKLSATGTVLWYTILGGPGDDRAYSLDHTADGGFIITGTGGQNIPSLSGQTPLNPYSNSADALIIKLSAAGAVQWYTFLGGMGTDFANSIHQTVDGGYIVAGGANPSMPTLGGQTPVRSQGPGWDFFIVKLAAAGNVQWYTFLGNAGDSLAEEIQQTGDGGFIVTGYTNINIPGLGAITPLNAYSGGNDFLTVKLAPTGAVQWYTMLGSSANDGSKSVIQTSDGGYVIAGNAQANIPSLGGQAPLNPFVGGADILLIKLNSAGAIQWHTFFGGAGSDEAESMVQLSDGGFVLAGMTTAGFASVGAQTPLNAYAGGFDGLVIRLKGNGRM